jgi:uncharacterized protein YecE (DUF72 family)
MRARSARVSTPKERFVSVDLDARLYIGPAGWQYDDWYGPVYPSPRPRGFDPLAYIASYFNLIEINSTFYRIPTPESCRRWVERIEIHPRFLFTAKAHQSFTHRSDSRPADRAEFVRALSPLFDAGRLGAVLLQFPWSFRFDAVSRQRLDALIADLDILPLALEVRHASWESDEATAYLSAKAIAVCGVDQPVIGESLRPYRFRAGPAGAYFRFHGRNYRHWFASDAGRDQRYDYLYRESELSPWADVIRSAARDSERVFVVLNNHFRGQAPANAFELSGMLLSRPPAAPATLRRAFPDLATRTTVRGDAKERGDLFDG